MTDYASMDAAALNRAVAERLGYAMKVYTGPDERHYDYELVSPNGEFTEDWLVAGNINEAWEVVWDKGEYSVLPDYANDLNAALALVADMRVEIQMNAAGWPKLKVHIFENEMVLAHTDAHSIQDAAAAVCRAWLAATE